MESNPPPRVLHVVEDDRFQDHRAPARHPECPERLDAVRAALAPYESALVRLPLRPAQRDELLRIHDPAHLARIELAAAQAPCQLDADTFVSPQSRDVALLAAGGAIDLTCAVIGGTARMGLAAVRPPGHHAEGDRAMGFCLLNNVALAARAAQDQGVGKILILDWDVHHGNGTQHSFDADPSVLYVSTHQYPHYPGTGAFGEAGRGPGIGATINLPLPGGSGDDEHVGCLYRVLAPVARRFAPELILVSCGFDAHVDDPLSSQRVTAEGYAAMTRIVRGLAEDLCGGRLVFVLEGGYSPRGLHEGTTAVVETLLAAAPPPLPPLPEAAPGSTLFGVLTEVENVHGGRHPDIGAP